MANSPDLQNQPKTQVSKVAFGLFFTASFLASIIGVLGQSDSVESLVLKLLLSVAPLVLTLLWPEKFFGLPGLGLMLLSFVYGLFRGAVVQWPVTDTVIVDVLIAAAITTLWWAVIYGLVNAWEEFETRLRLLQKSGWEWISAELRSRVFDTAQREMENLQTSLIGVLTSRASESVSRQLASQLIAQNLRQAISNISGMRISELTFGPAISFTKTIAAALKSPSFDIRFLALGSAALSLLGIVQLVEFWRGLESVAMHCLILTLGAWLMQTALKKGTSALLSLGLLFALAILSVALPDLVFQLIGLGSELGQLQILLGGPIGALALLLGALVFGKVQLDRQQLISEFALRLSDRELIDLYIHHSLQSELQSISMLYEESANTDSASLEELAERRLANFSERDLESEFRATLSDPRSRLKRVLESWSPMVEVSAESFLRSDHSLSSLACRVIEEAISNSVRYGGATKVQISSRLRASKLRLEVSANGGPVDLDVQGGIGRRLLEVASYSWKITNTSNGTLLTVTLPYLPSQSAS